jgi:hypothetical protein
VAGGGGVNHYSLSLWRIRTKQLHCSSSSSNGGSIILAIERERERRQQQQQHHKKGRDKETQPLSSITANELTVGETTILKF